MTWSYVLTTAGKAYFDYSYKVLLALAARYYNHNTVLCLTHVANIGDDLIWVNIIVNINPINGNAIKWTPKDITYDTKS